MMLLHAFTEPQAYRGGFVAIGNFDGVHRGHQSMAALLVQRARAAGVPAVVLTFNPPPVEILRPGQVPPRLSTLEQKARLLAECGVDVIIAYPTDHALLNLTPEAFFEQIVLGELDARGLVEGPNFFFGHDRAGDVRKLGELCERAGRLLDVVSPVRVGDRLVSSSEIRASIAAGRLAAAVEMLGHPYQLRGTVARGAGRGRSLGTPTANLESIATLVPPDGVYAGTARWQQQDYPAAVHIGPNTTFGENARKVEVHLLDFSGDLYGQHLEVGLLERIRDTATFPSAEDLRRQLERDLADVRGAWNRRLDAPGFSDRPDGCR